MQCLFQAGPTGKNILRPYRQEQIEEITRRWMKFYKRTEGVDIYPIRDEIKNLMWEKVGVVRDGKSLQEAMNRLEELLEVADQSCVANRTLFRYNMEWNEIINTINWITVARMVSKSASLRTESRGSHYRSDFKETDNHNWLVNIYLKNKGNMEIESYIKPINATRFSAEEIIKANIKY